MSKLVQVDPLLEMLRNHANQLEDWDEEDKRYFCVNWDLCRDKLMEITKESFEATEILMHFWAEENMNIFKEYFCAPHLLAEIIYKTTLENITGLRKIILNQLKLDIE